MTRTTLLAMAIASALFAALVACGSVPPDNRIGVVAPDRAEFAPVGQMLNHRCGSLDCHGNAQRNLVIYGCEGLRRGDADVPGCRKTGGTDTTEDELDGTYRSVVGLEPVVMSTVVSGKGAHPELLTVVRKARGDESHKGGALFVPGDAQDNCFASWLTGTIDKAACAEALKAP